jgi:hypothetical protein
LISIGEERSELGFEHNGRRGKVTVFLRSNPDEGEEGFLRCTATIEYAGEGYNAFFGWVQLVRSTDNASEGREFEMDPFFLFQDLSSPYCFYGFKPTLFDSPTRRAREPMSWLAHSFLSVTPLEAEVFADLKNRRVRSLVGFSWGFEIDSYRNVILRPFSKLGAIEWNSHLPFLRKNYPTWRFDEV